MHGIVRVAPVGAAVRVASALDQVPSNKSPGAKGCEQAQTATAAVKRKSGVRTIKRQVLAWGVGVMARSSLLVLYLWLRVEVTSLAAFYEGPPVKPSGS